MNIFSFFNVNIFTNIIIIFILVDVLSIFLIVMNYLVVI